MSFISRVMNLIYTRTQPPKKPRIEEDLKTPERLQMELDACGASIERDIPETTRIIKCMIMGGTGEYCEGTQKDDCTLGTTKYTNDIKFKSVIVQVSLATGGFTESITIDEDIIQNGILIEREPREYTLDGISQIKATLIDTEGNQVTTDKIFFVVTDQTEPNDVSIPVITPSDSPYELTFNIESDVNSDLYITPTEIAETSGAVETVKVRINLPSDILSTQIYIYLNDECSLEKTIEYSIENFSVSEGTYEVQQEDVQNGYISIDGVAIDPTQDMKITYKVQGSSNEYTETIRP